MMASTYYGNDRDNTVHQNPYNNYYNIYTYDGNDTITLKLNNTYVEAGEGNDTVTSTIERGNDIYLGSGADTYIGNGFSGNSNKYDQVFGGYGDDTMKISTWASDYYGEEGKDTFYSVGFYNLIAGGKGTDTVDYSRQDSDPDLAGKGIKVDLYHEYATSGGNREETLLGIENANGTAYDDTLIGADGKNVLRGNNGDDLLDGRAGNDKLYGGNGNDELYGADGNDRLYGGKGSDILTGDAGADTFIFTALSDSVAGSKRDVIADFNHSQGDQIDLSGIDAIKGGGDDAFTFIGTDAFSDTAGELRFKNGVLYGDIDGDGKADIQIKVDHMSTMHQSDFIL
jgi:serralysin